MVEHGGSLAAVHWMISSTGSVLAASIPERPCRDSQLATFAQVLITNYFVMRTSDVA